MSSHHSDKPTPSSVLLGRQIRRARRGLGWTQSQLGQAIGLTDPNASAVRISRYENGLHVPDGPTADALSKALGLPLSAMYASTDTLARIITVLDAFSEEELAATFEDISPPSPR